MWKFRDIQNSQKPCSVCSGHSDISRISCQGSHQKNLSGTLITHRKGISHFKSNLNCKILSDYMEIPTTTKKLQTKMVMLFFLNNQPSDHLHIKNKIKLSDSLFNQHMNKIIIQQSPIKLIINLATIKNEVDSTTKNEQKWGIHVEDLSTWRLEGGQRLCRR